ncbi:sigma-70 family RNA polymerase sigma factor [Actinoplanes sp. NPDC051851]|uniref:RNA polymerase sigma factor n=1 Tax=Actinoplanes sp. NPDC051851 TaxID=3154753 RepID=UPI00341DC125
MIRFTGGDWDLAEECAQDAFMQALRTWPESGVPDQPLAWLTTTARRKAIDRIRRAAREAAKLAEVAAATASRVAPAAQDGEAPDGAVLGGAVQDGEAPDGEAPDGAVQGGAVQGGAVQGGAVQESEVRDGEIPDERLELIFACCHPALALEAQVALTLRCLGGLSTAEIARAFLVPERTMGQRLFRAKQRIRHAGIALRVPPPHLLPERLPAVLYVLILIFDKGTAQAPEAIRLARLLVELMPDEPEALGLLALMLLHDARRATRLDAAGDLVLLADQDRSRWDHDGIAEGAGLCERALRHGRAGPFQLQAAIAACHATAPSAAETDWPQIAGLYGHLARVDPGEIVALNRAVAVSMTDGPAAALRLVDAIDRLDGYHLLHAVRADLLRRLDRHEEAAKSYRTALRLAPTEAERRFLSGRLAGTGH